MDSIFTATLRIDERGIADMLIVTDATGAEIDVVTVTPAEDSEPYDSALMAAGWRVVGAGETPDETLVERVLPETGPIVAVTRSGRVDVAEPGVFIGRTAEGFEVTDSAGAHALFATEVEARAEAAEWLTNWADDSEDAAAAAFWAAAAERVVTR